MQEGFFSWDLGIENLIMRRDFLGGQFLPFLDLCKGFLMGKRPTFARSLQMFWQSILEK
jgi:hypothetical protein